MLSVRHVMRHGSYERHERLLMYLSCSLMSLNGCSGRGQGLGCSKKAADLVRKLQPLKAVTLLLIAVSLLAELKINLYAAVLPVYASPISLSPHGL